MVNILLKNLWTTYGEVDIANLTATKTRMKVQWAHPYPIEYMYKQLTDCKEFASQGSKITYI